MYHPRIPRKTSPSFGQTRIIQEPTPVKKYPPLSNVVQRAQQDPSSVAGDEWQQLQLAIGYRATKGLRSGEKTDWKPKFKGISTLYAEQAEQLPVQAKLVIGQPNDKYEQEADRVAGEVVQQINTPNFIQLTSESLQPQPETESQLQTKPETITIRRSPAPKLQREALAGGEASTDLTTAINSARGSGQPLDPKLQASMGQAMGADFSGVRIHTDAKSDRLNQSIQAKAFTTGQDVFFRQGEYQPGSRKGQETIAHELTHVVQQKRVLKSNANKNTIQRQWNIKNENKNIDWDQTEKVEPLLNNPVLFFTSKDGDRIVVKAEDAKIGQIKIANYFHEKVNKTKVAFTRDITRDKPEVEKIIKNPKFSGQSNAWEKISQEKVRDYFKNPEKAQWLEEEQSKLDDISLDDLKGRLFKIDYLLDNDNLPYLVAMEFVKGETAKELSNMEVEGASSALTSLLMKDKYLFQLGQITAVDLFLENPDRLYNANLGNWMHNENGEITLIDQIDANARAIYNFQEEPGGSKNYLDMLKKENIKKTAGHCIKVLLEDISLKIEDEKIKNQMVEQFQKGMKQGLKKLFKVLDDKSTLYFKNKPEFEDGFWDTIEARKKYLRKLLTNKFAYLINIK